MRFEGKLALVTGGSRGIGEAIALRLAREGADVVIGYLRNQELADQVCHEIESMGRRALAIGGDLRDVRFCKALVREASEFLGGLDFLVSNAAIGAHKDTLALRPSQWDLTMESSVRPLLLMAQAAAGPMESRGGGAIVALSSLGSRRVVPGYAAMGTAKAAVESLTRYLAAELGPKGIRVNCAVGGIMRTDAISYLKDGERMLQEAARHTPLGRAGEPDDLARVVAFLLSDDARWVCGQTVIADGGLSLF